MAMDYETILADIGGFGKIQFLIFLTLSFTSFKAALDLEILSMSLHQPLFRCAEQNSSDYEPQNFAQHCSITRSIYLNDSNWINVTSKCEKHEYKHGLITKSMIEEFEMLCDNRWKASLMMSVYFLGNGIGMLAGTLGDKIGRKKILVICGILDTIFTILPAFMKTFEAQLLARFLKGLPSPVYYQGLLVISEITVAKHRAILGNLYWLFWCIGYMSSGGIVFLLKEWRVFQLFCAVFCANYIIIFLVVPESPRWQILKGRQEDAIKTFRYLAKWNGIKLEKSHFKNLEIQEKPTGNLKELFSYPEMRKKTLVIFYILTMFAFCYFGLSTDTTFVIKHIALNAVFNGAIEIPSSFLGWLLSDKFGRKWPTIIMTFISGACVIIVPTIPLSGIGWLIKAVIALTGKCLLTSGYCIMDVYAAEVLPTSVRNNGLFLAAFLAMVGNITAPFINNLAQISKYLPGLVFGMSAIVSAFTVVMLPETEGMPLPDTVESSETFVKGNEKKWALEYHKNACQDENTTIDLMPLIKT